VAVTSREIVLDSSVVVKWFTPTSEPNSLEALHLLDALISNELIVHCPALTYYEIGNVLGKLSLPLEAGLKAFFNLPLKVHHPDPPDLLSAAETQRRCGGSFYDAVFISLADQLGVPLVTADSGQARRCGKRAQMLDAFVRRIEGGSR